MNPHDDPDTWGEREWDSYAPHLGDVERRDDEVYGVLWLPDGTYHEVREQRIIGFVVP